MTRYVVRYITTAEISVEVEAEDEETATDLAYDQAKALADQEHRDGLNGWMSVSFDGIDYDFVGEL